MNVQTAQEILRKTRDDYTKIAQHFSQTRKKRIWPDVEQFLEYINPGDKILDVGCGNGRLLQLLSGKEVDYTGLDISPALVEEAKKEWSGLDQKVEFQVGDILDLKFSENSFDVVFCLAVLYHIPSKKLREKAITNLAKVVKPGGYVFITVWNLWQPKFLSYIRKNNFKRFFGLSKLDFNDFFLPWKDSSGKVLTTRYCHAFRKKELKSLVSSASLKIIQLDPGNTEINHNISIGAKK